VTYLDEQKRSVEEHYIGIIKQADIRPEPRFYDFLFEMQNKTRIENMSPFWGCYKVLGEIFEQIFKTSHKYGKHCSVKFF